MNHFKGLAFIFLLISGAYGADYFVCGSFGITENEVGYTSYDQVFGNFNYGKAPLRPHSSVGMSVLFQKRLEIECVLEYREVTYRGDYDQSLLIFLSILFESPSKIAVQGELDFVLKEFALPFRIKLYPFREYGAYVLLGAKPLWVSESSLKMKLGGIDNSDFESYIDDNTSVEVEEEVFSKSNLSNTHRDDFLGELGLGYNFNFANNRIGLSLLYDCGNGNIWKDGKYDEQAREAFHLSITYSRKIF